jgi:uncharacterized protein (TIGR02271 family)
MTMFDSSQVSGWIGRTAVDANGDKIGTIDAIYEDDNGSGPEWFAVSTGMFGTHLSFVPVHGATVAGDDVRVAYDKGLVKDAPRVDADGHISREEEDRLYQHYGMEWGYGQANDDAGTTGTAMSDTGVDTAVRGGGDDAMTRSEEELRVDTREREAGRVRLRKWVETEQVNVTVPVRREVARLVTEPITDANVGEAMSGPDITENEFDVTLTEEEVVVDKQVVPKERVRLEKDTVVDEQVVSEQVRKERVATEGDVGSTGERPR